jgi:uncharacterized protein YprB with RNaseH-like and TPR domain
VDQTLKRRLEILKARAKRLKKFHRSAGGGSLRNGFAPANAGSLNVTGGPGSFDIPSPDDEGVLGLEVAVPGSKYMTSAGPCYVMITQARAFDPCAAEEASRLGRNINEQAWIGKVFGKDAGKIRERLSPGNFCFLDIETAGLTPNTYVFLCGVMTLENNMLITEQVLARDYSEENALLCRVLEQLKQFDYVITYNGKAFDIPFLRTRMAVCRLRPEWRFKTLDLLKASRAAFSARLGNCKLETVERYLKGFAREGDIPGSDVPGVYHDFVRTGDAHLLKGVIYHNRMDLLAMVLILNALCKMYRLQEQ